MKKSGIAAIVGASLLVVIILAAGALLFVSLRKMRSARTQRDAAVSTLDRLHQSNPFPSGENVATNKTNLEQSREWVAQLTELLHEGAVGYDEQFKSPPQFMEKLQLAQKSMIDRDPTYTPSKPDAEPSPILPANFMFGFDRYLQTGAQMPLPDDVPRLVQQLGMVERLTEVLYGAGIVSLKELKRETFEKAVVAGTGTPGAPGVAAAGPGGAAARPTRRSSRTSRKRTKPPRERKNEKKSGGPEPEMYSSQRFEIRFSAFENAIVDVMNTLGTNELFSVIQEASFLRQDDGVFMPTQADQEPKVLPQGVVLGPKDWGVSERMVSGATLGEPVDVKLVVDVYTFKGE